MNKYFLLIFILIFLFFNSFAEQFKIAPLAIYDENAERITLPSDPAKKIFSELEKHWFEGLIDFSVLNENKTSVPVTVIDARKISAAEKADYLIYGYIKKNTNSWNAEIKLYSLSAKKIIKEFFASDNIEHYDRMMNDLCRNILYGIEEITGLNQEKLKLETTRPLELRIPSSVFYWNPIDSGWGEKILGIAGLNTGVEFYPSQKIKIINEMLTEYSLRFDVSWNVGINKRDSYPLIMNTVSIALPFLIHFHKDNFHALYGGVGFGYEIEMMRIKPKYEAEQFLYQGVFILNIVVGYEYRLAEKVNLFTEIVVENHLCSDNFIALKSCIGVSFKINRKGKKE